MPQRLLKADREKCWGNRDAFWKCADANDEDKSKCKDFRKAFEESCPKTWVEHFDRKHEFEKYKEKLNLGWDPVKNTQKSTT